jgi:hypothetical protein
MMIFLLLVGLFIISDLAVSSATFFSEVSINFLVSILAVVFFIVSFL